MKIKLYFVEWDGEGYADAECPPERMSEIVSAFSLIGYGIATPEQFAQRKSEIRAVDGIDEEEE